MARKLHSRTKIAPSDWVVIIPLYERGERSCPQLARDYGVAPNTMSKGLRRRGAVKASRLAEVTAAIEEKVSAEAREARRARMQQFEHEASAGRQKPIEPPATPHATIAHAFLTMLGRAIQTDDLESLSGINARDLKAVLRA